MRPGVGPDGWRPTVEATRDGRGPRPARRGPPGRVGRRAGHLLVTCGDDVGGGDGTTQVLVPTSTPGLTVSPMQTVDLTRRFSRRDLRRRPGPGGRRGRAPRAGGDRRRPPVPGAPRPPQRGVGRRHADGIRHDGRVGLRPLLLRAAAGLVPGPQAPVRRHDELARGVATPSATAPAPPLRGQRRTRPSWSAPPRPTSASTAPSCCRTACRCTGASGSRSSTTCTCTCVA